MSQHESEPRGFEFKFQTKDQIGLLVRMLLEIRSEVDALAVFAIELHARLFDEDGKETAERFEQLKDDFLLKRAFSLQDNNPPQPEE